MAWLGSSGGGFPEAFGSLSLGVAWFCVRGCSGLREERGVRGAFGGELCEGYKVLVDSALTREREEGREGSPGSPDVGERGMVGVGGVEE